MPGPPPKDPKTRQRANKVTTAATLPPEGQGPAREIPPLPVRECRSCTGTGKAAPDAPKCAVCAGSGFWDWHELTVAMWNRLWKSPMASEFVEADVDRAYILADLVDRYWWGETELAGEIRLQGQCFGTSPLDRRRLQWEVPKPRTLVAEKRREALEAPRKRRPPMSYLRAIK